LIGGSNICACGYSITDSRIHIGLKLKNNDILPDYTKTSAFPEIGNTISKYIEA
jgi:hypothetical protein